MSASFDPAGTATYHVVREHVFGQDYAKALAIWRNKFRTGCHRASTTE
jgi:cyclopropane fatty-acyl-phospholipid synthase-like methyltransferase